MDINFRKFRLKDGLGENAVQEVDVQREMANALYDKGTGLACHALALKIYNSEDGVVSLSTEEFQLLTGFSEAVMTPKFIDSIRAYAE